MGLTTLDPAALEFVLHGIGGPVMNHVVEVGHVIKEVAATLIHTSDGEHEDGTPHLKDRGHVDVVPGKAVVIFDGPYAERVHQGGGSYEIYPKNGRALAFKWPKAGPGVFVFAHVTHPATEGFPFLRHAATIVSAAPLV